MLRVTSLKDAADRLSIPRLVVRRMARQGLISVINVPGVAPQVDVEEVRQAIDRYTSARRDAASPTALAGTC